MSFQHVLSLPGTSTLTVSQACPQHLLSLPSTSTTFPARLRTPHHIPKLSITSPVSPQPPQQVSKISSMSPASPDMPGLPKTYGHPQMPLDPKPNNIIDIQS